MANKKLRKRPECDDCALWDNEDTTKYAQDGRCEAIVYPQDLRGWFLQDGGCKVRMRERQK